MQLLIDILGDEVLQLNLLEFVSTVLGIVSVWLVIRRNIWCWPIGIGWAGTSALVYFQVRLYSDLILMSIYVLLQIYGWYSWLYGGRGGTELRVRRLVPSGLVTAIAVGAAGTFLWGFAMHRWTNADLPYWDATTTVFSLVAQILVARKFIENWAFWIYVNTLAIGIYLYKDLNMYAILYGVFLVLAILGHVEWLKVLKNNRQELMPAAETEPA